MNEITRGLYQFSTYIPPMDFTIHQYLLASDPAILFAAGTAQQAGATLPDIKKVLGDEPLKYVLVSHMESDEAAGVFALREAYPGLVVVCGGLAARELPGFGYPGEVRAVSGGQELQDGDLDLRFFDYPAEVHGQDGVLCLERSSGVFYSADLFLRFGNGVGKTIGASWRDEVAAIDEQRVPDAGQRKAMQDSLLEAQPAFVAVGHGFCIRCE